MKKFIILQLVCVLMFLTKNIFGQNSQIQTSKPGAYMTISAIGGAVFNSSNSFENMAHGFELSVNHPIGRNLRGSFSVPLYFGPDDGYYPVPCQVNFCPCPWWGWGYPCPEPPPPPPPLVCPTCAPEDLVVKLSRNFDIIPDYSIELFGNDKFTPVFHFGVGGRLYRDFDNPIPDYGNLKSIKAWKIAYSYGVSLKARLNKRFFLIAETKAIGSRLNEMEFLDEKNNTTFKLDYGFHSALFTSIKVSYKI